jgi:hypothetical protein
LLLKLTVILIHHNSYLRMDIRVVVEADFTNFENALQGV